MKKCDLCGAEIEGELKTLALDTENKITLHVNCFGEIQDTIETLKKLAKENEKDVDVLEDQA